jgi:NADPH:quinone reductase-like Zn-dependent oxidoreductase
VKAFVFKRYGGPDELHLEEVAKPSTGDEEVLVKVHAVALNDWDWQILQGIPFANRVTFGLLKPKKHILGSDVAGRVEAVGARVHRFRPGDEVLGDLSGRWGGFAEYVCARQDALVAKPAAMSFVEAAAIPQAATLALQGLRDKGRITRGQKILINGAGGGVGTFAVQLARPYGAEVTGVDSVGKLDLLRSLGFAEVIDYAQEDFTRAGRLYDLILDVKTNRPLRDYLRVLTPRGAYVTVGGETAKLFQVMTMGPLLSFFGKKRVAMVILKLNKDLDYLCDLSQAGKLTPVIDGPYGWNDLPQAMRRLGEGKHKGKVVISLEADD